MTENSASHNVKIDSCYTLDASDTFSLLRLAIRFQESAGLFSLFLAGHPRLTRDFWPGGL